MSNIFQIKETSALYHSCGLRYLAANVLRFLSRELYLTRPLYRPWVLLFTQNQFLDYHVTYKEVQWIWGV